MDLALVTDTEQHAELVSKLPAFAAVNLSNIRGNVSEALKSFGSFGFLEEYTKHDISHLDEMLRLYDKLIPASTSAVMTSADWLMLTLGTYFHDFGLLVTRDEYDRRSTTSFNQFKQVIFDTDDAAHKDYRAQLQELGSDALDRFIYQEFVRSNHARRIKSWLGDKPDPLLGFDDRIVGKLKDLLIGVGDVFKEDLGLVCESHHENDLENLSKYPLNRPYGSTHGEEVNLQYVAILLRTADLLHITSDRVPSIAALIVNPRNPKSQLEWAKQAAVRTVRPKMIEAEPDEAEVSVKTSDTIEVHATFKDSEGFFGLTSYLNYASQQLAQSFAWARDSESKPAGVGYSFPWRRIDTSNIEAKGFVSEPFEFSIDQGRILDLLTGHTLYNDTRVVARELVQNSLDAVRLQSRISAENDEEFEPRIWIEWNSASKVIDVRDNGVGMTQKIIESNFLKVGSSRYQDPEFKKSYPNFFPISRFGIGVLSAFMVADSVSVTTSSTAEDKARQMSLRDVHGKYLVRLIDKQSSDIPSDIREHGTSVRLKLRPSASLGDLLQTLKHWVVIPGCSVELKIDDQEPYRLGYDTVANALKAELLAAKILRESGSELVDSFGSKVEVRSATIEGIELAYTVRWNRWLQEWAFLSGQQAGARTGAPVAPVFGTCIGGVRVTDSPAGFAVGGVITMANATGGSAPRTNVARTAIEKTDEYRNMLAAIYRSLSMHVSDEMDQFESNRGFSVSRAAAEASFLASDLSGGRNSQLESEEIMHAMLREVPAIVLESGGVRARTSLNGIEEYPRLLSVESTMVNSLEAVLTTVRGAEGASLQKILDAMGVPDFLARDTPLICNLSFGNFFGDLFMTEREISELSTDADSRMLRALWEPVDMVPRWSQLSPVTELPAPVTTLLQRVNAFDRMAFGPTMIRFARPDAIVFDGIDANLVKCHGLLLVLPCHELHTVQPVDESIPNNVVDWVRAWLFGIISQNEERYQREALGESGIEIRLRDNLLEVMEECGMFSLVSSASVRTCMENLSLVTLDVRRWDRRGRDSSDGSNFFFS
ncbi:MAG: ATP-binding protein [Actinomycetota bacterium]|nr:ATP-binding protein [Actinomycetota bacterium]MDQ2957188.1 ATP-binding protein [Actinomycetota bacterium]